MNFFNKLFKKKKEVTIEIKTCQDFWNWFIIHEKEFFSVVKKGGSDAISIGFFDKIGPKLDALKEGVFYLTGMLNDTTADLILTADGNIANYYLIEELIASSPNLPNWKFRAHKPAAGIKNTAISMAGYEFSSKNIHFYANGLEEYPDEIDITIVHDAYTEENKKDIINGCYIFLDNFLGELKTVTVIDNIRFAAKKEAKEPLVPIEKLESFIIWREKEFIEKYEEIRKNTENDSFSSMEATLKNGKPLIAIVNTDLLSWKSKASHPWILKITLDYQGDKRGMPDNASYTFLNEIEDEINTNLKDYEGYLNIGRETADSRRHIHYACKDYIKPASVTDKIIDKYKPRFTISYDLYKDKYWQSFEKFNA